MPFTPKELGPGPLVWMRGPVDSYTSYGLHVRAVALDFLRFGLDVRVYNSRMRVDETYGELDPRMRCVLANGSTPLDVPPGWKERSWELLIAPMDAPVNLPPPHRAIYCTMHESDFLSPNQRRLLEKAAMIVVPCQWNLETYQQAFPGKPIHKIPLGIHTDVFTPRPFPKQKFVFGTAGRFVAAGGRKNPDQVIDAFLKAFPDKDDVELHIKCYPDCPIAEPEDPRIIMTRDFMHENAVANWLHGIHCYVNVSAGEAFGLWLLQAMACGRLVISHGFGGSAEFLDSYFKLPHKVVQAQGPYYFGSQAQVSTSDLVDFMRDAYDMPMSSLSWYGRLAAQRAEMFSWRASNLALVNLLASEGFLQWP